MKKKYESKNLKYNKSMLLQRVNDRSRYALNGCEVFEEIDSTNQYLLSTPYDIAAYPRLCLAYSQIEGRGQRGRVWESSSKQNIYMSLAYLVRVPLQKISSLALVIGIAVSRVLLRRGVAAGIKWPNDVLVDGKKIAGILIETKVKADKQILIVIGLGLNVDMRLCGDGIDQPWTDLYQQLGEEGLPDRTELVADLLLEMMQIFEEYQQFGFAKFKQEFSALDLSFHKTLSVKTENKTLSGRGLGVDDLGCLCVDFDGQVCCFHAADVGIKVLSCY